MVAHLRIGEGNDVAGAKLDGGARRFANGRLKDQASSVIGVAAHQVKAAGRSGLITCFHLIAAA